MHVSVNYRLFDKKESVAQNSDGQKRKIRDHLNRKEDVASGEGRAQVNAALQ